MPTSLLTRTIITRNLFKASAVANVIIDWFEVVERELGSTSSEFKVKFEIKGKVYVVVVHNTMSEDDVEEYLEGMLETR